MSDPDGTAGDHAGGPEGEAAAIERLLDDAGIRRRRGLVTRILRTGLDLGRDGASRLDLKIASAALEEMREAFAVFAPHEDVPKISVFGSARTLPDDPLYILTERIAHAMAEDGWMIVTGAGPGIMQAAAESAGTERAIGVSIRLPFEEESAHSIHDPNHVVMKYFFTRKLMLMKESKGFVCLPGGFGTMDEMFELLTLQQTGKAEPVPIVLLDVPGGTFWEGLRDYVREEMVPARVVSPDDFDRVLITDSVDAARREVRGFWRNYRSLRWFDDTLVVRLRAEPTDAEVEALDAHFGGLLVDGRIERTGPLPEEVADRDETDAPRLRMRFARRNVGSLYRLIRALNELPSAPVA